MTRLTDEKYAKHKAAWLNHIASLEAALTKRNERIAILEATIAELENTAQPTPEGETPEPGPEAEPEVPSTYPAEPQAGHARMAAWLNHIVSLESPPTKRKERIKFLKGVLDELGDASENQPAPETETIPEVPDFGADHYEYTGETMEHEGETLYRIRSTIDRPHHGVKTGDKGGWVSRDMNLERDAWIGNNAKVHSGVWVYGKAWIGDNAVICADAAIYGEAQIGGNTRVNDASDICGRTMLNGDILVCDYTFLSGDFRVTGHARVEDA